MSTNQAPLSTKGGFFVARVDTLGGTGMVWQSRVWQGVGVVNRSAPMNPKFYALRVFPNGEFGVGMYRKFKPEAPPPSRTIRGDISYSWTPSEVRSVDHGAALSGSLSDYMEATAPGFLPAVLSEVGEGSADTLGGTASGAADGGASPLGSSNAVNSHKRSKRGTHGLTSYAKKMLRNGCWMLERQVCWRGVAMVTATIPGCDKKIQREIVAGWSEIVRIFTQWLSRKLKAARVRCPAVLGVTEIQEKRQKREGGLPLHVHLLFGSKKGRTHIVSSVDVCTAWKRAVCSVVPCAENLQWNASTRVETVRESVTRYLCKYMTKGSPEALQQAESEGFKMPSSWWFMVGKMKSAIKKMTVYRTDSVATETWYICIRNPEVFEYCVPVNIGSEEEEITVGFAGKAPPGVLDWMRSH